MSAEAYGVWNKKASFTAPVYEKTPEQSARIIKCLEPSFLFQALDKAEMQTVILAFKEKVCQSGDRIIEQGADGNSMFLIEDGTFDCIIKFKNTGEEKVVKSCKQGDVFGELALLYNCPRAASVQATSTSTVWELDRDTFSNVVKEAASNKRNKYTDFLKKVNVLSNMADYEIMSVADAAKVEEFTEKDSVVIKQGDPGDRFFILLEGECEARKVFVPGSEAQKVMSYKVGDYFGELALLNNDNRGASVYTTSPTCKLLYMDRKSFGRLCGNLEDILRREAKRYETSASSNS